MAPMLRSHRITMGANKNATFWVPQCCRAKRPTNTMQEMTTTAPINGKISMINTQQVP